MDIVSPATRSKMMAGIKSKNTRPEVTLRKLLHKRGFRYRLHDKRLPGTPDIVFNKYHAIIFVHGCFWHGHGCQLFKWPSSNQDFWKNKITSNLKRDANNRTKLMEAGWRIGIIWECAIRKSRDSGESVAQKLATWLQSESDYLEIES